MNRVVDRVNESGSFKWVKHNRWMLAGTAAFAFAGGTIGVVIGTLTGGLLGNRAGHKLDRRRENGSGPAE
jgi:hypothetical protein